MYDSKSKSGSLFVRSARPDADETLEAVAQAVRRYVRIQRFTESVSIPFLSLALLPSLALLLVTLRPLDSWFASDAVRQVAASVSVLAACAAGGILLLLFVPVCERWLDGVARGTLEAHNAAELNRIVRLTQRAQDGKVFPSAPPYRGGYSSHHDAAIDFLWLAAGKITSSAVRLIAAYPIPAAISPDCPASLARRIGLEVRLLHACHGDRRLLLGTFFVGVSLLDDPDAHFVPLGAASLAAAQERLERCFGLGVEVSDTLTQMPTP